jgi:large subunit ribosomal protein L25
MKRHVLKVTKREVFGKKLKALRREGILPGNVYGKDIASTAVQVPTKEFKELYKEVGATGLIEVQIEGEKPRPVLIHDVHMDHINHVPLHADFYQVNLKEKVKTMVPVTLIGEPQAVVDKLGELLQTLSEIEVEALPADLPEKFEIDVTKLSAVDEQITIADLVKPQGVEILTEPEQVVVKIAAIVEEPEPTTEEATTEESSEGEIKEDEAKESTSKETKE